MKRKWQIRKAVTQDAQDLQSCIESAYSSYLDRMGGIQLPPMDQDYAAEIRDFPVWVVECEDRIVGGIVILFEEDYAMLANIAVDPDFLGPSIGGGLMKFAESMTEQRSYSEMRLATHVLLNENISLYLHLGWTETGRDKTHIYMKKKI
ncbi:MAG: GNAT family N-acetyltransferase [Gammaproteobacteria bacterium]|nr:GNAT family N-acetyltransferase [Gammaproteobacteria bacterium]